MAWVKREFDNAEVDGAGKVLAHADPDENELDRALSIINNWRSSHNFTLNTFQCTLGQVEYLLRLAVQKRKGSQGQSNPHSIKLPTTRL
jgi:hypothetical protein